MKDYLLELAKDKLAKDGKISCEQLATELIKESNPGPGQTDRGRRLNDMGLPTKDRLAQVIRQTLKNAGLYEPKVKK